MAWIKHYASKLAYLLWLTPSGQVAHATLDRRLCRTRIFSRNDEVQKNSFLKAAPAYTYLGAKSKKISWGKATTAAVLASMIATVLGYIGGAAIIGAVGSASLGVIASAASNGVVNAKTYSRKTGKITNYKYIWSFTPSGSRKYGDYTSYVTV